MRAVCVPGRTLAAALTVPLLLTLACGPRRPLDRIGSDGRDYLQVAAEARAFVPEEGVPGGVVTLAVGADPATFNPLLSSDRTAGEVAGMMFEGLTRIDGTSGEPAPGLAQSWDVSADGREHTFHLRPGLLWSDSTPLTSADVVYTLDTLLRDSLAGRAGPAALLRVCGDALAVAALDSLTVRITVARPCALLLRALSLPVMPGSRLRSRLKRTPFARLYGTMTRPESLVVNGPFMLGAYVPTQRVVLRRNPRYWRRSAAGTALPYLDSVVLSVIADENLRKVRFEQGQTDCYTARGSDYALLAQDSGAHYRVVCAGPSRSATALVFNLADREGSAGDSGSAATSCFGDRRFRAAAAHALDMKALMAAAGAGGFVQTTAISPVDTHMLARDATRYGYDTTRARALLAEAGFADRDSDGVVEDSRGSPVRFTVLTAAGNKPRVLVAEAVCGALGRIGLGATLQVADYDTVVKRLVSGTRCWDAAVVGLPVPAEPLEAWDLWHSAGQWHLWNPGQQSPASAWETRVDSILGAALRLTEPVARRGLYREWQRVVAAELPLICTYLPERIVCMSSSLANASVPPNGGLFVDLAQVFVRTPSRAEVTGALLGRSSDLAAPSGTGPGTAAE